ncbi:hypothetical protein [Sulfuriflexus mobilis]|uniref:hypothetical protein n=1 Tax=Sulfuriflexus mobilis TaxID=1811807 RepID=UPI000F82D1CA|nr:hypothetical protein [Sulfuriflexus mobilis]
MQKSSLFIVLATTWLFIFSDASLAARGYEGYYDTVGGTPWFDGAKSTIDYQNTIVGSIAIAVWSGIDNGGTGGMKWFQGGWAKWHNGNPRIYWEFTDKNGNYQRGYDVAPAASETYEQSRNGANVEWKHGVTVYKTVAWNKFDTIEFRKVQYGAEMLDSPNDHTPGSATSKNNCAASTARRAGAAFAFTGLANQLNSATNGHVETYLPVGSGNFRTWDDRD